MGIRTRLIAAIMAMATLTAVVGVATASAAQAKPTAAAPSDKKDPGGDRKPGDKSPGDKKAGDKKPGPGAPEEAVKLLAAELHISNDRARQVFTDLDKVTGNGEEIVKDPAFIAIAKGLGITPQRLLDALIAVKKAFVRKEGEGKGDKGKAPSGAPAK
jgi:hypothetical protein